MLNHLNDVAHVKLKKYNFNIFYNPKDLTGPSFHLAYDLDKGFSNYERVEKDEILSLVPENGCILDIGANIGLFSVYFTLKRPDIKILSFEPHPKTFECLKNTIDSNHFKQITPVNKAIGKNKETLKLYTSVLNDGGHSLTSEKLTEEGFSSDFFEVEVAPLSHENMDLTINKVHVIKIDVEGAELSVLEGIKTLLEEDQPVIMLESSNKDLAEKSGIYKFFSDHFPSKIEARIPGTKDFLSMEQLSEIGKERLLKGNTHSNYFFYFNK
jgi:FkbM family methyltransferase